MTQLPPELSPRPASRASGRRAPGGTAQRAEHGLTGPGVVVVVLVGSLLGWLVDRFTVDSGLVGEIAFVAASVYAAFQVRRSELAMAVIVPPLVFGALTVVSALVGGSGTASDRALAVASDLATGAPALFAATGSAAVIVGVRWWRGRRSGPL